MTKSRAIIGEHYMGMVELISPANSISAAAYTLLGAYLGGGTSVLLSPTLLRAALVVTLTVAYSFVINHYHDVVVDSLNQPTRPIPSGRVSRRIAGILALSLAISALAVTFTLNKLLIGIVLFNITLSTLYSYYLKSTVLLGNITIAFLNASIVVYGNLAIGSLTHATLVVCILTFLYILAQEILYTVKDFEGDTRSGVCTAATYLGKATALHLFRLFALLFVVVALLVWFLDLAPTRYLYTMIPCCVLPVIGVVCLVSRSATYRTVSLSGRVIKTVRFLSLLPAILLK